MNKEELKKQLGAVEDIFETTVKVKGENFADMVKFTGSIQSFCRMVILELADHDIPEERLEAFTKHTALFASALCHTHGKALGIGKDDLEEVFKIVDSIEDRIKTALEAQ
jgi:hypothetical protein